MKNTSYTPWKKCSFTIYHWILSWFFCWGLSAMVLLGLDISSYGPPGDADHVRTSAEIALGNLMSIVLRADLPLTIILIASWVLYPYCLWRGKTLLAKRILIGVYGLYFLYNTILIALPIWMSPV